MLVDDGATYEIKLRTLPLYTYVPSAVYRPLDNGMREVEGLGVDVDLFGPVIIVPDISSIA